MNQVKEAPTYVDFQMRDSNSFVDQDKTFLCEKKEIKKQKRRNTLLDIDERLERVLTMISNQTITVIHGRVKPKTTPTTAPKGRSSNYIGVSRNGDNWQVLINNGKFKKYIGTFSNEKEAAIAYDFYSI
mmetsp:Transcript_31313/g.35763  ORF Transcript_31313/g.35763 Transcript_31313/m.35763 type:complete len:129 (-) Transcript_31313:130-516(-)